MRHFTKEEDQFIKDNYLKISKNRISIILERSKSTVPQRMNLLGLVVPNEIKEKFKQDSYYKKGHIPKNTGKKQVDYMSPEAIEKTKSTRFKKGSLPHNSKKDFEEVERKDRNGRKYIMIKLPENTKLIYKHIWIWEKENGKIPKGFNIIFKNKNSLDCRIENLECLSNKELMERNTMQRFPEKLRQIIHLKAALTRQINKKNKTNG